MDSLLSPILHIVDLVLHVDQHLRAWTADYGPWIYVLLFLIVFCETGLVVTPFLPGDSLLFAAGALTALQEGGLSIGLLSAVLIAAAIIGNQVNFAIGYAAGDKLLKKWSGKWINPAYIQQTEVFMTKYGAVAIVLTRFAPILRTFTPFIAGIGKMDRRKFFAYNVIGAVLWVEIFLWLGYFFGNIPAVQKNFSLVIVGIVVVSLLPAIFAWIKTRRQASLP